MHVTFFCIVSFFYYWSHLEISIFKAQKAEFLSHSIFFYFPGIPDDLKKIGTVEFAGLSTQWSYMCTEQDATTKSSYYKRHNVTRANNYCTVKTGLRDNPLWVSGASVTSVRAYVRAYMRTYATFFVRAVSPEPLGRFWWNFDSR